jgi:MFS family permease
LKRIRAQRRLCGVKLLRQRDFGLLAGAVGVSALGDWLALTPLALYLQRSTGSGLIVAGLFVAIWSPSILFAPLAGLLVDRLETRRLLGIVSLAQAGVAVGLSFAHASGPVLALAALLGTGFALAQPAEFALVPAVAGSARLTEANGLVETSRYLGFVLGPLAGGLLSAAGGFHRAMLVNAVTFVAVAAASAVIRVDRPGYLESGTARSERARDGLAVLFRDRVLGLVMIVAFASLLFMTASAPAEVFFAKETLNAGDFGFGVLLAGWTIGMALGALVLARRVRTALALAALTAIVVQSVGLALPTLWLVFAFALVSWWVGGLAHGFKNVLIRTLIHERVPERLHGRAYAAYNGMRNFAELFAIMGGGALVAAIGGRWTLLLAGGLPAVAGIVGLGAYRRLVSQAPLDEAPAAVPLA